jgi:DNA-binding transcriptional regulator PaaX
LETSWRRISGKSINKGSVIRNSLSSNLFLHNVQTAATKAYAEEVARQVMTDFSEHLTIQTIGVWALSEKRSAKRRFLTKYRHSSENGISDSKKPEQILQKEESP